MAQFKIATPAGASFTTVGGGYELELIMPGSDWIMFMRLYGCLRPGSRPNWNMESDTRCMVGMSMISG